MKKPRPDQCQPGNLYIRWRKIPDAEFLWWVDGRDTPQFSAKFANWLAHDCRVHLVRAFFNDSVEAFITRRRNELYPAHFRVVGGMAGDEKDIKRLKAKFAAARRLLPKKKREEIHKQLCSESEQFRIAHVEPLVKRLSTLTPARQVVFLSRRIKAVQPAQPRKRLPRSKKRARVPIGRTTKRPTSLTLEEVEFDYGYQFPPPHKANQHKLLFNKELGQEVAGYFARKEIPYDSLYLARIAMRLYASPLAAILKEEFQQHPTELRQSVQRLLAAHLKFPFSQHGWATASRQLARECRAAAYELAGWPCAAVGAWSQDPPPAVQATMRTYRQLHRAARHNDDLVKALWDFLAPGFTEDDRRDHHVLLAKLAAQAWPEDVILLVQFLFQDGPKKRLGLVPQWLRDDKSGSAHRLNRMQTSTYEHQVKRHRRGERESDYFDEYEAEAGVPKPRDENQRQSRYEAWTKRRRRILGNLPR